MTYFLYKPIFLLSNNTKVKKQHCISSEMKKILVIRLDTIGDIVLTTSFLRELRYNFPKAWITLVIKPEVYNLVETCPYVNEILVYYYHNRGHFEYLKKYINALKFAYKYLLKRNFDLAILPRWDFDNHYTTFIAYFSGTQFRIGYSEKVNQYKKIVNKEYDKLLTHAINNSTIKHTSEYNLDIIKYIGGTVSSNKLEIWLTPQDEEFAKKFYISHNYDINRTNLLIVLGIGAGEYFKIWPIDRFTELGIWLINKYNAYLLIVGGQKEKNSAEFLEKKINSIYVINAVNKTTLRQTAALLKYCNLYIGNDSGPMHLASAVGIPIIELNGYTKSKQFSNGNPIYGFSPYGSKYINIQPEYFCENTNISDFSKKFCISGITVDMVKQAIEENFLQLILKNNIHNENRN
jgi:heptosyltransferase-2